MTNVWSEAMVEGLIAHIRKYRWAYSSKYRFLNWGDLKTTAALWNDDQFDNIEGALTYVGLQI